MAAFVIAAVVSNTFSLKADAELTYGGFYAYRPFQTFWFVSALFFVALLYRPVSRLPLWGQAIVGGISLTLGVFAGPLFARTPLSAGSAVTCLCFVIAGVAVRRVQVPARAAVGLALIVAGGLLVVARVSAPVDLKAGNFGTPYLSAVVAVAISFGLVLLAEAVFERLPARVSAVTTGLAVPALTVVLLHPVVLWAMRTGPSGDPVAFGLAALLPWLLGLVAVRSRYSRWLTGVGPSNAGRKLVRIRPAGVD